MNWSSLGAQFIAVVFVAREIHVEYSLVPFTSFFAFSFRRSRSGGKWSFAILLFRVGVAIVHIRIITTIWLQMKSTDCIVLANRLPTITPNYRRLLGNAEPIFGQWLFNGGRRKKEYDEDRKWFGNEICNSEFCRYFSSSLSCCCRDFVQIYFNLSFNIMTFCCWINPRLFLPPEPSPIMITFVIYISAHLN